MARKKRDRQAPPAAAPSTAAPATVSVARGAGTALPGDTSGALVALIFAVMMFLAPALGVPHEEMLQDTLKSIVVSFAGLGAALAFFWVERDRREPLRWHAVTWLPLLLLAYALGSLVWSHTYLGAVEAIRWFIFAAIVWLGTNTLSRERLVWLAWGVHAGAVVCSLWAALQFWADFSFFPQGPHPASTFVNRNFFAEFAVCTLPFSFFLLARVRQSALAAVLAMSTGLVVVAILMTGTRSALIALWLQLLVVLPFIAWFWRRQFAFAKWDRATRIVAVGVLLGTVIGLGLIPTGDAKIAAEGRGMNALERGFKRTGSISTDDTSLGIRMIMWRATTEVIRKRPLVGVGAGAWESEIPRYQTEGEQLETDYYVHNEFLQLLAEYGAVGWIFLLALGAYLLWATARTLLSKSAQSQEEGPMRAVLLCSLMALLIVSNVGFPWRMAATGALFALCLAGLAASDSRLAFAAPWAARRMQWNPTLSRGFALGTAACLALAAYITQQAAECEQKIVRATKIALSISASGDPKNPKWDAQKAELLRLMREGIAINPHYRKITPIAADELAKWGDWKDATWIWESVLSSRPYIVAIMSNVARGYATMGHIDKARRYLERAKQIQPRAPSVRSLEMILLLQSGQEAKALEAARASIAENIYDFDMANMAFHLAARSGDVPFALKAMQLRIVGWPESAVGGYVQLGSMFAKANTEKSIAYFREALRLAKPEEREAVITQVPPDLRAPLGLPPAQAPSQTSASKG
jgi:O-antigen ligase